MISTVGDSTYTFSGLNVHVQFRRGLNVHKNGQKRARSVPGRRDARSRPGMTENGQGMTENGQGMTKEGQGMTKEGAGREMDGQSESGTWEIETKINEKACF